MYSCHLSFKDERQKKTKLFVGFQEGYQSLTDWLFSAVIWKDRRAEQRTHPVCLPLMLSERPHFPGDCGGGCTGSGPRHLQRARLQQCRSHAPAWTGQGSSTFSGPRLSLSLLQHAAPWALDGPGPSARHPQCR